MDRPLGRALIAPSTTIRRRFDRLLDRRGRAGDPGVGGVGDGEVLGRRAVHGQAEQVRRGGSLVEAGIDRDPGGAAVLAGATIRIIDAAGNDVPLLTARNGNFWTTRAVVYPLEASASACPTTRAMIAAIVNGGGNCNTGGCHGPGAERVYLP